MLFKRQVMLNSIDKAQKFVSIVSKFDCDMDLAIDRYVIDAKSIMGVFSMNLLRPMTLTVHNDDPREVFSALNDYLI